MKITKEMMSKSDPVKPNAEAFKATLKKANEFFGKCGYRETELSKASMIHIARRYMDLRTDDKTFSDCAKGFALIGNIGTGKTIIMKFTAYMLDVDMLDASNLSVVYSTHGEQAFWDTVSERKSVKDMVLDDLGAETDSKRFGNVVPMVDLIYKRYSLWQNRGYRTWISSNLTSSDLVEKYGERAIDRLREMCTSINATGESMR